MAGGFHSTFPEAISVAFVAKVTSKLPSALYNTQHVSHDIILWHNELLSTDLLIVQDNIGSPDVVARNMEHIHAAVFIGVPLQFIVIPVLKWGKVTTVHCNFIVNDDPK